MLNRVLLRSATFAIVTLKPHYVALHFAASHIGIESGAHPPSGKDRAPNTLLERHVHVHVVGCAFNNEHLIQI